MATTDPAALFATHHARLFRYFHRAVGHAETARDLTQEVFLRVARTDVPDAAADEINAWLFRIARNLALDHHRHQRRRPEPLALADDTRSASQDVEVSVRTALATLADLDRDVFLMREVAGLSYNEIATACELTPDAVRSRIHRTRLALREQLSAPIATSQTTALRRRPQTT